MNPIRAIVDGLKASRREASLKLEERRKADEEAILLEVSTLERYARLTESLEEARRGFAITTERMTSVLSPDFIQDAARSLDADWGKLSAVVSQASGCRMLAPA
jgi:glutamine synthetase